MAVRWRADQPDDPPPIQDFIPTMVGFTDEPNVIFGEEHSGENQGLPLEAMGGAEGAHMPESILKHDTPVVPVGDTVAVAAPVMRLDHHAHEKQQQQQQQQQLREQQLQEQQQQQKQQQQLQGFDGDATPAEAVVAAEDETTLGWREVLLARVRALFPANEKTMAQADIEQAELAGMLLSCAVM